MIFILFLSFESVFAVEQGALQVGQTFSNMKLEITSEHAAHESRFKDLQKYCQEELTYRQKDIADADYSLTKAQSEYMNCDAQLSYAESKLKRISSDAIQELIGMSFKIQSFLNQPPVDFSQLEQSLENNRDDKAQEILGKLHTKTAEYNEITFDVHPVQAQLFSLVNDEKQEITELKSMAIDMENCRKKEKNLMFRASDTKARNENMLRDVANLCGNWKAQLDELSVSRTKQIEILDELEKMSQEKYGVFN